MCNYLLFFTFFFFLRYYYAAITARMASSTLPLFSRKYNSACSFVISNSAAIKSMSELFTVTDANSRAL